MSKQTEEWVDVVNDLDQPVGKMTRDQALEKEALHRSVGVLVFNEK